MSYPNADISFPGLFGDWRFTLSPKLLDIGNGIYWYGVLIAAGLLIALWFCMKRAPRYGLTEDDVIDTVLWAIPFAIVGARVYYVLFYLDQFRLADGSIDWAETYRIWDGGLAIYGGILAAFLTAWLVCRKKQLSLWALADCCVAGFFIGQAIGRWGNFFNREAFGGMTELPWRMRLWISGTYYIDVHPTFLYESLWNVAGLLLLCLAVDKVRRFDGENTCFYFLWYGIGPVSLPRHALRRARARVAGAEPCDDRSHGGHPAEEPQRRSRADVRQPPARRAGDRPARSERGASHRGRSRGGGPPGEDARGGRRRWESVRGGRRRAGGRRRQRLRAY